MKFLIVVCALFAIQGCLAKAAPKPDVDKNEFEDVAQKATDLAKTIGDQLGISDLDTKKIGAALNENTNKLLANLQSFFDHVKTEGKAHEGEVNSAVKTVQDKISTAAADLKKAAGPDATKKAEEIKVEFKKAYSTVADQLSTFVKAHESDFKGAGDNFQKQSKTLLDNIVALGENLEKQIKTAVEEHEKTHKH